MKKLMKSLPIVAKVLGDKYGVQVEVGGTKACTDGNTIHLPALPDEDRKAEILARGYIDHEAAHVRFKSGLLSGTPLERGLQNILEDIRIESRMKERYRGCGGNFNRLVAELVADGSFKALPQNAHPGAVVQSFLLHRLRCDVLGQKALSALADQSEARFRAMFSRGKATRIAALGYQAEHAASVDEIKTLVTRILTSLEEDDEPETPDRSGSSQSSSSGEPSDSSQSGQDDKQNQAGDSGAEDSDSGDQAGSSGQGQSGDAQDSAGDDQDRPGALQGSGDANASDESSDSDEDSGGRGQDAGQHSSEEPQSSSAAQQALSADDSDLLQDMGRMIGDELEGQFLNRHRNLDVAIARDRYRERHLYSDGMSLIDPVQARKATNALRSRLSGLIQASKQQRTPPKRSGRRIDSQHLARLGRNDLRVFRARADKVAVNTAVHILIDRSGSMSHMIGVASEAMYAAAQALESIADVSLETAAFPVADSDVATLTRFGHKVRYDDYRLTASGGTPMAEALRFSAYRLVQQPEPRRIALVVTDGAPRDPASAKQITDQMMDYGIEVFGIGIGGMTCPELFRQHCVIHHVLELPKALFGLLEQPLIAQSA